MRLTLAVFICTALFLLFQQGTHSYASHDQKPVDPLYTYVLAIGSCPPWHGLKHVCRNDVELFTKSLVKTMGVPAANIKKIIDPEATYQGVVNGFKWLREKSSEDSAVIVYYNGHGMLIQDISGGGKKEEVFLLWSQDFPFAGLYAVMAKIWMTDKEFAGLLAAVPGRAKLVVVDACHAEGTEDYFLYKGYKVNYELGDEALLASTEAEQLAYATEGYGLFTLNLTEAMSTSPNMVKAFDKARKKTLKDSEKRCREMKESGSKNRCGEQGPTMDDPHNVVSLFELGRNE